MRRLYKEQSEAIPLLVIRHFMFHTSAASGQETASLIKEKKLMNVEHRTSNIEHRVMYSTCLKRLSEANPSFVIRHSTFVIPM
ncbi:hypothetical protein D1AOALGA4SA_5733 [Olavius algarvensis Delta 1 endosymbiont]|nr:hypothetical protein D1AOALGA4SA_5733 [Olavius algarvensis Delta 1 endosymbiont]